MAMKLLSARRGRPQKFGRPSRAVTLTLPEDVIAALTNVDQDLSRAVVRLSQSLVLDVVPRRPAELSPYGDSAVIVVGSVKALNRIPGVTLVPLPDGRALISLEESMTVADFELKLRDLIDENKDLERWERSVLSSIAEILKSARRTRKIIVHQRSIIVLQSTSHRRIATA
jgi:hypothetical protein